MLAHRLSLSILGHSQRTDECSLLEAAEGQGHPKLHSGTLEESYLHSLMSVSVVPQSFKAPPQRLAQKKIRYGGWGRGHQEKNQELLFWISSHSFDASESLESEDVPHSMP